jgi:hypothetical protein
MDALGNVLVVVYTWRDDRPRLISARQATPQEREQYGVEQCWRNPRPGVSEKYLLQRAESNPVRFQILQPR